METEYKASLIKNKSFTTSINFSKIKNETTIYSEGVMYGIDWSTGLAWQRVTGQGCPTYCEAFKENFDRYALDKHFKAC